MFKLKMTKELKTLVESAAAHCGLSVSEIFRAVRRGIGRRGLPVIQSVANDCMANAGNTAIPVRGFALPDNVSPRQFRIALAARCREALRSRPVQSYQTDLREGIDYTIVDQEE